MATYVIMGPHIWGAGPTLEDAKSEYCAGDGNLSGGYVILTFDDETQFRGINMLGDVRWDGNEPTMERVNMGGGRFGSRESA
jgi:hypothetical protein